MVAINNMKKTSYSRNKISIESNIKEINYQNFIVNISNVYSEVCLPENSNKVIIPINKKNSLGLIDNESNNT